MSASTPEFQQLIAAARARKGLSLSKLAQALNERTGGKVPMQTVSNWEHGRRYPPTASVVVALADILDLDAVELLHAGGKIHPDITEALRELDYHKQAYELAREIAE